MRIIGLTLLLGLSLGCDRSSPVTATQPTVSPQAPVSVPAGPQPSVTQVTPDAGSTDGTYFKITGTGFVAPRVMVGGILAVQIYSPDPSTIYVTAPAHAAGKVDVVVTNADGQAATAARGFTYVQPESLDANGDWEGGADSNYETLLRFTIQGNALTSVSCGTSSAVSLVPPVPITRGTFSFLGADGARMGGTILSASNAIGTISIPSCIGYPWFATKQQ
jgi:hypothetical protein